MSPLPTSIGITSTTLLAQLRLLLIRLEVPPRGLQLVLHLLPSLVAVLEVVPVAVAGVFVLGCSSG